MKKSFFIGALLFLLSFYTIKAQQFSFVENKGQWEEDFDFKLLAGRSAVFLEGNSLTFHLSKPLINRKAKLSEMDHLHGKMEDSIVRNHSYRIHFVNSKSDLTSIPSAKRKPYHNYILGNNPSKWKSKVGLYGEVLYNNLYDGIDIKYYFNENGNLKYDLLLTPRANPNAIKLYYEGADKLKLTFGNLLVKNQVEDVLESKPYAYQIIEGVEVEVECSYKLDGDTVSFELGNYDKSIPLVIDPVLIFSSYVGSVASNFGYTATYSIDGGLYGAGIIFNHIGDYPTTVGAYDTMANGSIDIGISKFSADGSDLLYSTYLGGSKIEMPYSLLEGENKELIVIGNTGSVDFPVSTGAFQDTLKGGPFWLYRSGHTYPDGIDMFVTKLDSTGGSVVASTYIGGTNSDGMNFNLKNNYGDEFRGDIAIDTTGNIYVACNTHSNDFPVGGASGLFKAYKGGQDGIFFSLTPDLDALRWANYLGGSGDDGLFSIKVFNDKVFVAGGTNSNSILGLSDPESYHFEKVGATDGLIASFDANTGSLVNYTYNGTTSWDLNYFIDYDYDGNIYVFGQTAGAYPIIGKDTYAVKNSAQFIQMFTEDLKDSPRSMVFGDGSLAKDLSPTALMVDTCRNVYISGWGDTRGLEISSFAFKPQADQGNDFYFMVLDASWKKLNYATPFGEEGNNDHVDGGTSRFNKDGTIYQAVCAGCGGSNNFPTTDSAYSRVNLATFSGNGECNLGVIKFRMEPDLVSIDVTKAIDSACIPYHTPIQSQTYNADIILVTHPDGTVDTITDGFSVRDTGLVTYYFVAIDTICGFKDSIGITYYGYKEEAFADFEYNYDSCDTDLFVEFENNSRSAMQYVWDFGDGSTSTQPTPTHHYLAGGRYEVMLIAFNTDCNHSDTLKKEVYFRDRTHLGSVKVEYSPCENAENVVLATTGDGFENYVWYVDGIEVGAGKSLDYSFSEYGLHQIKLLSIDSICNNVYETEEEVEVYGSAATFSMPNVFTPNNDGGNDTYGYVGDFKEEAFTEFNLQLYNRWGILLFETSNAVNRWDGNFEGEEVPQGVYYYVVSYKDDCGNMEETKGFFHLYR